MDAQTSIPTHTVTQSANNPDMFVVSMDDRLQTTVHRGSARRKRGKATHSRFGWTVAVMARNERGFLTRTGSISVSSWDDAIGAIAQRRHESAS